MIVVRHAPTASNKSSIYMGATDVPATPGGLAEAQAAGAAIRALGPYRVGVSSPLARAAQTLEVIRPAGLQCITDERLAERRLGVWEGREKKSLACEYPEAFLESGALDARYAFEGGETLAEFSARVSDFLREYRGEDVLVVTHNGWIRTARYLCGEIPQDDIFLKNEPHNRPLLITETAIR